MTDRPTVAVIGAGFSGVLTALRLLSSPDGPNVRLIEKGPRFGRGAAYATGSPHHILNVRATNMSAFPEQPSHFRDWLGARGDGERMFVTRDEYGQYLQSLLREAASGPDARRLVLEHDDASALARHDGRWAVTLGIGRILHVDAVVLAIGNLPPPPPDGADPAVLASRRYVADPWTWTGAETASGEVLLLGSGLTAVDVALSLTATRPDVRVTALSRHGLAPRAHASALVLAPDADGPRRRDPPPRGSPTTLLRQFRRRAGDDWRAAFDDLRPHVQAVWRGWTDAERRQFVRHLKPWWDVHRHRMAPQVAGKIAALQSGGGLQLQAGHLIGLRLHKDGVEATWSPRGSQRRETRRFGLVVNCFGPRADLERSRDPLVEQLFVAGLARADDCRLGLDVDVRSRVLSGSGEPTPTLFAVGPISRGAYFEVSSVPDIRIQAAECADAVVNALAVGGRPPSADLPSSEPLGAALSTWLARSVAEIDVELAALKYSGRVRNAWELRGRRAALGEIALWLDTRKTPPS